MPAPMHRDPRLIPLSHDHHQALARAREATQAVDGSAPHDTAALAALAARCAAYFDEELDAHFKREEKHLLPLTRARFGRDDDLVTRVRADHSMIRKLTRRLTDPDDPAPVMGRLAAWAKALSDHIRFEEREWFEALQNSLPEADLDRLGRLLAEPVPPPKAPAKRKAAAKAVQKPVRKPAQKRARKPAQKRARKPAEKPGKKTGKTPGKKPGGKAAPKARARKR